jgi:sugar lactone lactonase YvrE
MHNESRTHLAGLALVVIALGACSPDGVTSTNPAPAGLLPVEPGMPLQLVRDGDALPFTPLAASAACVAGGKVEQLQLPAGFLPTTIATEGAGFPDLSDMITVNETGHNAGRFLYRTHELGANAAVSVTDLSTGLTRILAQRADWERFDGLAWTPWGTLIAGEETGPSALKDPAQPGAEAGHVYEIDPSTGAVRLRQAIGSRAHEGLRFDSDGNLYGISETAPGYIYRFVPDRRNDLSSGQLYALKIVTDLGDRTGWGEWVALDRAAVLLNSVTEAAAKGATGYSRPEDVEIGTSTGSDRRGNHRLFVALTGEDRVLAIDLNPDDRGHSRQVFVSDYVRDGVNAPADFDFPDNLALDQAGNLYITEDPGGSSASGKTKGDDVWFAPFNQASGAQSLPIQRFLSITDCDAEPTGIYLSPSGKTLFIDVQHRGGADPRDLTLGVWRTADADFRLSRP